MDSRELTLIYEKYQRKINDIWRSLWPGNQTKNTRRVR